MSEDTISRQAVIDTVRKIILGFFSEKDGVMTDTEKTLLSVNKAICNGVRELPPAQPEKRTEERTETHGVCLDAIDRQATIDALEKVAELFPWRVPGNRDSYDRYNEAWNDAIGRAEIEIEKLSSAQPDLEEDEDIPMEYFENGGI